MTGPITRHVEMGEVTAHRQGYTGHTDSGGAVTLFPGISRPLDITDYVYKTDHVYELSTSRRGGTSA